MEMEKLLSTTLSSHSITHSRLKSLSALAQSTEDHISRVGLALSIRMGEVEVGWKPTESAKEGGFGNIFNEKQLKGKTLFKGELPLWMALVLRNQQPAGYSEWRGVIVAHWERGVEELASIAEREGDWIRILHACLPN